jgi:hypothetical protein
MMRWAMTVPENFRLNNWVYSEMLIRYFPEFYKNIKWQKTGRVVSKINSFTRLKSKVSNKLMKITGSQGSEFLNYQNLFEDPLFTKKIFDSYDKSTVLRALISYEDLKYCCEYKVIGKLMNVLTVIIYLESLGLDDN